ncbi:4'-phosphopantetheinyl transferase family protein [Dawidia soli]|uniref:4'-phosphopantetheinyl transferase superfamily protein n=1 Tax=Dawidia soli TaxID=2782352 RepID=A0AAP2DEA8_9BACT|nr:4'-phosphopantetheinyl transferase superfamily protein [Dawidia soli]MBT1689190.1 4'-phosphopantetheinyl transferase superfamily protein [Dawidia soli]
MLTVTCVNRTSASPETIHALAQRLGLADALQSEADPLHYARYVLGRWLILMVLRDLRVPATVADIRTGLYGKPYIPAAPAFSLSHSHDLIVCATLQHGPVGIDIEYLRPLVWPVYQQAFSQQEWRAVANAPSPSEALLHRWTQKESVLKADGRGLQVPLASVALHGLQATIGEDPQPWHLTPLALQGYAVCVSTRVPVRDVHLKDLVV